MADIEEGAEPETTHDAVAAAYAADNERGVVEDYHDAKRAVAVEAINPTMRETVEAASRIPEFAGDPLESDGERPAEQRQTAPEDDGPRDLPQHFSEAERAVLGKLEPGERETILARFKSMTAAHMRRSQEIAPFRQVTEHQREYLDHLQATPEQVAQGINELVETRKLLHLGTHEQKLATMQQIAQTYGVDLSALAGGEVALAPAFDPVQQQAMAEQQAQQAEQQQLQETVQQVEAFRAAANPDGTPRFPYFDTVRERMSRLAAADQVLGETPELANLYERAVYADPDLRARMDAMKQRAWHDEHNLSEAERVRKARNAGGSISGGGSPTVRAEPETTEDAVRMAIAAHRT